MRFRAAILSLFALLCVTRGARAGEGEGEEEEEEEEVAKHGTRPKWGWGFGTGLIMLQPGLGSTSFSGEGTPYLGGPRESFDHTGREVGVRRPLLFGIELRMAYVQRYFEVGGHFFFAGHPGGADAATNPEAAKLANASSISATGGGAFFAVALPLGRTVTVMFGPDLGIRGFSIPLTGFRPTTCHNKYGTYSCPETATSLQPYFQPRVGLNFNGSGYGPTSGFYVMPWIGADVYPSTSVVGGLTVGFSFAHDRLR